MAKIKYRLGDGSIGEVNIPRVVSSWVNFGVVQPYHTASVSVDLSVFGYTGEPQVWFQPYQGAACVSVGNVTPTSCSLWCYNPTNGEAPMQGWLKSCDYV